jgi:hypothetical protein
MSIPCIEDILSSIEENADDVYSLDPSFRTNLRDTLEYYENVEEDEDDTE